jgi:methylmalonyl-CoA carboxyltransferase small subunit
VKLKITIDNKVYEVEVEATEPEPEPLPTISYSLQPGGARVPAAAHAPVEEDGVDEAKVCRSPINGLVVRIVAQPGQTIQPGDPLLVLEAMKMETNITAPCEGKVARIRVEPSASVTAGQILVDFE